MNSMKRNEARSWSTIATKTIFPRASRFHPEIFRPIEGASSTAVLTAKNQDAMLRLTRKSRPRRVSPWMPVGCTSAAASARLSRGSCAASITAHKRDLLGVRGCRFVRSAPLHGSDRLCALHPHASTALHRNRPLRFHRSRCEISVDNQGRFMSFSTSWFWLPSSMVEQLTLNQ